jgi:Holliday junction DNA helicase RuvA
MIGSLIGKLQYKKAPFILLDVNGVGYEIETPMTTFFKLPDIGQMVTVFTHLSIREDAHLLFGFQGLEDRQLFRALIKLNGIGPKVALSILSHLSSETLIHSLRSQDVGLLMSIPGIGKKTAERILVELSDRIERLEESLRNEDIVGNTDQAAQTSVSNFKNDKQVLTLEAEEALMSLGYKPQEAQKKVKSAWLLLSKENTVNSVDLIKQALQC